MNRPNYTDLILVSILAAVGLLLPLAPANFGGLRPVFALLLVFILPGYVILAALFPHQSFDGPEQLVFVLVTSIATTVLGGLLLHVTPGGIHLHSWMVLMLSSTGLGTVVAWFRRGQQPGMAKPKAKVNLNFAQGVLLAHAIVILTLALVIGFTPAAKAGFQGYSLLWVLPDTAAQPAGIRVGVRSMEFAPTRYRLVVKADQKLAYEWAVIELDPKQQWETQVVLPAEQLQRGAVEAELYRLDQPNTVYRHVVLRADSQPAEAQ